MFVETVSGWNVTLENISKKTPFFLVLGLRPQNFGHLLQKPKLQLMTSLSSNHSLDLYMPQSLGPYQWVLFQPQYLHFLLFSFKFGLISLSFRSSLNCSKQGSTDVLLQDITIACFFLGMILRSWNLQSLFNLSNKVLVRHKTFVG